MAQFTRTHGDYQPEMNYDAFGYTVGAVNAVTSAATVQPQGPKLDFFTVTASGSSNFTTAQVNTIVQTIQQLATVYIYEFTTAGPDTFAFACYPVAAWTTTDLDAKLTLAGITGTTTTTTATFTG